LGYLLGDEGSGYYFGKLICTDFLNDKLTQAQIEKLPLEFSNKSNLLASIYGQDGKSFISNLAKQLADNSSFDSYHERNINAFFNEFQTTKLLENRNIAIIGSYGFSQQHAIQKCLENENIQSLTFRSEEHTSEL